jgi:type I restriction enzyme R subunit
MPSPREIAPSTEKHLSQVPALVLLANLGWEILPSSECERLRGRTSRTLLESVAIEQMLKINRFTVRGVERPFDPADASEALRQLRPDPSVQKGLVGTNQDLHDRLTLGATIRKTVDGDTKSHSMRFIDWDDLSNNRFQATYEFTVDRNDGQGTRRCDIVLLVNGIPFAVIENKAPSVDFSKGLHQLITYQGHQEIAPLFHTVQLLLATNKNAIEYASVGAGKKFWLKWREHHDDAAIGQLVNRPLPPATENALFSDDLASARGYYRELRAAGTVEVTEQDRVIHALCRPDRLLEMARIFTLFDDGKRKVARHQQYFGVKAVIEQMGKRDDEGRRKGGVVWHTQGSGKSLTMVMLGKALALDRAFGDARLIIVTDRTDLDSQIATTFRNCDREVERATTGSHLLSLIQSKTSAVITTVINKFETAVERAGGFKDEDANLIVLVDEGHRTQHGSLATQMRRLLPKACYVGFTGTPILREDKATAARFGGIIKPTYTIDDAVADGAIVPLIYEGRFVAQHIREGTVDAWFQKVSAGLSEKQVEDLKRKYSRINVLGQTDQALYAKAMDISDHFFRVWKGTGFKAQVVAPTKAAAIKMKEYLDQFGQVTSEVIISGPDTRDGGDEVEEEGAPEEVDAVRAFWKRMMDKHGDEERYNRNIIDRFKKGEDPEILIVVSKLLTGFDCDRNTALYICKELKEHNLLQAIARVNRNCELPMPQGGLDEDGNPLTHQKRAGYIYDYEGLLSELNSAMLSYKSLKGYDQADLNGVVRPIHEVLAELGQAHRDVLDTFRSVRNKLDHEQLERHLANDEVRQDFSKRLSKFTQLLELALGSEKTYEVYTDAQVEQFRGDGIRLCKLRRSAALRYQDQVDMREYEPRILQLLNSHVTADPAVQIISPIDLSNPVEVNKAVAAARGAKGNGAKAAADKLERAMKRHIREKLEDTDPAMARKFSALIQEALEAYRLERINDQQLAKKLAAIAEDMHKGGQGEELPAEVRGDANAAAFYGIVLPAVVEQLGETSDAHENAAKIGAAVSRLIQEHKIVRFWSNADAVNRLKMALDDLFFDEVGKRMGIKIPVAKLDELQHILLKTAEKRFPDVG